MRQVQWAAAQHLLSPFFEFKFLYDYWFWLRFCFCYLRAPIIYMYDVSFLTHAMDIFLLNLKIQLDLLWVSWLFLHFFSCLMLRYVMCCKYKHFICFLGITTNWFWKCFHCHMQLSGRGRDLAECGWYLAKCGWDLAECGWDPVEVEI